MFGILNEYLNILQKIEYNSWCDFLCIFNMQRQKFSREASAFQKWSKHVCEKNFKTISYI